MHNTHKIIHCDIKPENYIVKYENNNRNKPILKLLMKKWMNSAGVIMLNLLAGTDPFASDNDSDHKDNIKFKNIIFTIFLR